MIKGIILGAIRALASIWMRSRGCTVGEGVILNGLPAVRRKGSGKIIIGNGVTINTARWSNSLNTGSAMNLCAENGAVLELKEGCGVSASQLIANVGIEIGEGSLIGAGSLICDSDMHEVPLGSFRPISMAPIRIGRGVFVGARSVVLKGVSIGDGAVIGAGSVVTSDIPPGVLAAGNPARVLRALEPKSD